MLQSQYNASAQHPDKYDNRTFTLKRAKMIVPDLSRMTKSAKSEVFSNPFANMEYAAHFEDEIAKRMNGQEVQISMDLGGTKDLKGALEAFLRESGGWVSTQKLAERFNFTGSYISQHMKDLVASGKVERTDGPRRSVLFRAATD